jgi:hypothetical protein
VDERGPTPQQLEEWEREAGAGRAEAAASLAAWYRRLELGPEELGGVVGRDASPDEARWTQRAVELGGFPYAWRAVDWATRDSNVPRAAHWTRTATALQCAAAGGAVRASDDLFVPFAWDQAPEDFCEDPTVLVQSDDRDAARAALGAAVARMQFVNTSGHEYADDAELEAHLDSLAPEDDWLAGTVSAIGIHGDHPQGPWAWIDGSLTGAMMSTMLQILIEESQRAGLRNALLRSGRRASRGDHTPDHA